VGAAAIFFAMSRRLVILPVMTRAEDVTEQKAKVTNVLEQSEENEREKARDEAFSKF